MKKSNLFPIFLTLCAQSTTWADTCPAPPSSVDPKISTSMVFNKKLGTYTYNYTIQSGQDSLIPIESFILSTAQTPLSSLSPTHWLPSFDEAVPGIPATFFGARCLVVNINQFPSLQGKVSLASR
jgi:hypothetical protein